MLRIEKGSDASAATLKLSGRIRSQDIPCLRSAISGAASKALDLGDVTLVDAYAVRFLAGCEREGLELLQCPPYIREWMQREIAEGVRGPQV